MVPVACLSENELVSILEHGCDVHRQAAFDGHLDTCDRCRRLVGMLAATRTPETEEARPPAPQVPQPGQRVGRYVLGPVLGRGGMGVVFAAYDPDLDRRVAIKLLRPELGSWAAEIERRLIHESKAMAQLAHPHVLTIHDVGRFEGQVFIAMELAGGGTLGDWIRRERPGWRRIAEQFARAGQGLRAAHEAGLVHRDFKPDNVLLTVDGRVRVADFGLAAPSAGDEGLEEGAVVGTPRYMAPEQHEGQRVLAAADQFSFCVAFDEALYGRHPFAYTSHADLLEAVKAGRLRPQLPDSDVPFWLRRIVLRGLSAAPADRWPSMAALVEALEAALSEHSIVPPRPEIAEEVTALRVRLHQLTTLEEAGRYAEAITGAAEVAECAGRLRYPPLAAESLYRLAKLHKDAGHFSAAQRHYGQAAVEAAAARDDVLAARIWGDYLVVIGYLRARSSDAALLRPVVEAAMARCSDDAIMRARFLNSIGTVTAECGQLEEARRLFSEAASLFHEAAGPLDPMLASATNNVGRLLQQLGRFEESRPHHARARAIWEQVFGPDHPMVAISLNNTAELLLDLDDPAGARALLESALAIRERTLPANHPFVALTLCNLGRAALRLGRLEEARAFHARALAIRQEVLDADHPDLADAMDGLGEVSAAAGDLEDARAHHERALAHLERAVSPDHPRLAQSALLLAETLLRLGRPDAARPLAARAAALAERILGPSHPLTLRARSASDRAPP